MAQVTANGLDSSESQKALPSGSCQVSTCRRAQTGDVLQQRGGEERKRKEDGGDFLGHLEDPRKPWAGRTGPA